MLDEQKELKEGLIDLEFQNYSRGLILDNKFTFVLNDKVYRVRMPNQSEQSLAEHNRNLMQLEFMKQPGCVTKKSLIKQLKESGVIDIEALDVKRDALTQELQRVRFALATKGSEDKKRIQEFTDKIRELQEALKELAYDAATYLSPCLDSRLEKVYIEYLTYLCLEEKMVDSWQSVWKTFEEFQKADRQLTNRATTNLVWLLLNQQA
jgi:ribosomal protein L29